MRKLSALALAASIPLVALSDSASAATLINFTASQGTAATFGTLTSGQSLTNDAGTYSSNSHPFIFLEKTMVSGLATTQVFLFHFDSLGTNGGNVAGTFDIKFDDGANSVAILSNQLADLTSQDQLYGVAGVTYATGVAGRGFEGSNDTFSLGSLMNNLQTVNYAMRGNGNNFDEVRFTVTNTRQAAAAAIPPVPEPATWAMMIAGFAAVGFSMRRRKRPTVRVNFA